MVRRSCGMASSTSWTLPGRFKCLCLGMFIKWRITTQSDPDIWIHPTGDQSVCVCVFHCSYSFLAFWKPAIFFQLYDIRKPYGFWACSVERVDSASEKWTVLCHRQSFGAYSRGEQPDHLPLKFSLLSVSLHDASLCIKNENLQPQTLGNDHGGRTPPTPQPPPDAAEEGLMRFAALENDEELSFAPPFCTRTVTMLYCI